MSALTDIFGALGSILKDREKIALLPAIASAAANVAANPTLINLQAQAGLLFAQAVAAQPGIVKGELGDFAAFIAAMSTTQVSAASADLARAEAKLASVAGGVSSAPSPLSGS